jgi:uncharacterized protein YebE (UPF0316 family)
VVESNLDNNVLATVLTAIGIAGALIMVMGLATIRTVYLIQGKKAIVFILAFFESLLNVTALTVVTKHIGNPLFAIAYAGGFATGTFIGITIENWIAAGNQILRIFTKRGTDVVSHLRANGFIVTEFKGEGKEGPTSLLLLEARRRSQRDITELVLEIDDDAFLIVDDIRSFSHKTSRVPRRPWWRRGLPV